MKVYLAGLMEIFDYSLAKPIGTSYFQEHLLPIHHSQNLVDDDRIGNGDEGGVEVAGVGFEAIQQGIRNTAEVDARSQHIGCDGVGAVDLEPAGMLVPSLAIDNPVEERHEQETIAAAHEHHGAGPQLLDDRHLQSPQPSASHKHGTDEGQDAVLA